MPLLKWFPPQGQPRTFVLYKPVTTVGPVLVTVEAPRTVKHCAEPSGGADPNQARLLILNRVPMHTVQVIKISFLISQLVFSVIRR